MTNFLLENPDAVFIHIPKCAGTSIRALWDHKVTRRTFGHIPPEWREKPSFVVVRNPESRFLSALRMFKYGNPEFEASYQIPVWPELTIDTALAVLADPMVPFDRTQRYVEANLKHHIIAQTHPFNCLSHADTVLRQENLTQDFETLRGQFGFSAPLPFERKTSAPASELGPTEAQRREIHEVFAEDYRQLGYHPQTRATTALKITPPAESNLWQLWPVFYSDQYIQDHKRHLALPDEDVDLTLFANMRIAGKKKATWPGRKRDINLQFHKLMPEMVGSSHLAHLLICCIVMIRRTEGVGPGLTLFQRIISEHTDQICSELNSRWLVSVCDTLADHGQTPAQRAIGLAGSLLANTVKLYETERTNFNVKTPWPPKARLNTSGPLFDGVISFWVEKGDMIRNLLDRVASVSRDDPVAGAFVIELMMRLTQHNTVYRRMLDLSDTEQLPLVKDEVRERLERITKRWL